MNREYEKGEGRGISLCGVNVDLSSPAFNKSSPRWNMFLLNFNQKHKNRLFIIGKTDLIVSFPCPASLRDVRNLTPDKRPSFRSAELQADWGAWRQWIEEDKLILLLFAPCIPFRTEFTKESLCVCRLVYLCSIRCRGNEHVDDWIVKVFTHMGGFWKVLPVSLNFSGWIKLNNVHDVLLASGHLRIQILGLFFGKAKHNIQCVWIKFTFY